MKQSGFPVPAGLVVFAHAGDAEIANLPRHPWFDGLPPDTRFAVRSSGIGEDTPDQSFAGIHTTTLNVQRSDIARAVAACRTSARSREALEYRRANRMSTDTIEMGVLVQCLVQAVASGVAFTINPVTGVDDEIVINSSWGLGEALVSGRLDPDEFVVGKQDGALRWQRIGEKESGGHDGAPSLSPAQIRELAGMLGAIERFYGSAQDVEWCHDGVRFWIVQSRPVTARRARADETEWTRANLAEVLPDLSPPQVVRELENLLNAAERRYFGRLLAPEAELGPMVKSFCGRLHFNVSQLRHICRLTGGVPAEMLRSLGHAGVLQPGDEVVERPPLHALAGVPALVRILWRHVRAGHHVEQVQAVTRQYVAFFDGVDPRTLPDRDLWSGLDRWFMSSAAYIETVLLLGGVMLREAPVRKACRKIGFPYERLVYPQLAAGERSTSSQQAFDLVELAAIARREPVVVDYLMGQTGDMAHARTVLQGTAFLAGLEAFLRKYGHRGRYETDWSLPRYNEDPTPLFLALRAHLETALPLGGDEMIGRLEREAAEAWTAFEQRLTPWQRRTKIPRLRRAIGTIKQYYIWREQVRSDMVRVLGAVRRWHLALADRFVERGWIDRRDDYFFVEFREIADVVRGRRDAQTLRAIVADRLAERTRNQAIRMPLVMWESELPALIRTAGVSGGSRGEGELTGDVVSAGCVEADVVVVRDPGDFSRMKRGAILVAPATDPSWTPLFTLASGVIVEIGGVLSHASTIAREYGLPALANVKDATRRLKTGDRVRLDATNGCVVRRAFEAYGSITKITQATKITKAPTSSSS